LYYLGNPLAENGFNPSGALLKAMIIQSGKAMKRRVFSDGSTSELPVYPSVEQGYGRVSIASVLHFGASEEDYLTLFVRGGARPEDKLFVSLKNTGDYHTYHFKVEPSANPRQIRVTLTYTDVAAYPSNQIVMNKLSLNVTCTSTGETYDRLNRDWVRDNVIVVDIASPKPNMSCSVVVKAEELVQEQPYALVMTGAITPAKTSEVGDGGINLLQRSPFERIYQELALAFLLTVIVVASFVHYLEKRCWKEIVIGDIEMQKEEIVRRQNLYEAEVRDV
jgi:hypothetical protein